MTRDSIPRDDLYGELEVSRQASVAAIEAAYRRLVKQHHPDVARSDDQERIKRLNLAREWLTDLERRRRYDLSRGLSPTSPLAHHSSAADGSAASGTGAGGRPGSGNGAARADDRGGPARSFGVNANEVRLFLASLRGLDSERARRVFDGRAVAHAKNYTAARRAAAEIGQAQRKTEWQLAREAASVIARGKLGDTILTEQVVDVLADAAGAIAIRDLLPAADYKLLMLPWTWKSARVESPRAAATGTAGGGTAPAAGTPPPPAGRLSPRPSRGFMAPPAAAGSARRAPATAPSGSSASGSRAPDPRAPDPRAPGWNTFAGGAPSRKEGSQADAGSEAARGAEAASGSEAAAPAAAPAAAWAARSSPGDRSAWQPGPEPQRPPDIEPAASKPSNTGPHIPTPAVSLPSVSLPNVSRPSVTLPKPALPKLALPSFTLPAWTLPKVSLPSLAGAGPLRPATSGTPRTPAARAPGWLPAAVAVAVFVITAAALIGLGGPPRDQGVAAITDGPTGTSRATAFVVLPGTPGESATMEPTATDPSTKTPRPERTDTAPQGPAGPGGVATSPPDPTDPDPTPRPTRTPSTTPTNAPTPTASPTSPQPTPTRTPQPTPTRTPQPTQTPQPRCLVPNLLGLTAAEAPDAWADAGFTGPVTFDPPMQPNQRIGFQSLLPDVLEPCSSGITVSKVTS